MDHNISKLNLFAGIEPMNKTLYASTMSKLFRLRKSFTLHKIERIK